MRNKFFLVAISILLVSGLVLVGCASPEPSPAPTPAPVPAPAPEKVYELGIACHTNVQNVLYIETYSRWANQLELVTGGRVKATIYPDCTLLKYPDMLDGVIKGLADMCYIYTPDYGDRFPLSTVMVLPGLGLWDGGISSMILWQLYEEGLIQQEYDDKGFKLLALFGDHPGYLSTLKKPVRTVADMKGLTLRVNSDILANLCEKADASGVYIPFVDVYMAMEKGVVDGALLSSEGLYGTRLIDVTKYHTEVDYNGAFFIPMNLDTWNSFPPDIQEAIDGFFSGVPFSVLSGRAKDDYSRWVAHNWEVKGHETITFSPEEQAKYAELTKKVQDDWAAEMEAKGLPGQKVLDRVRELVQYYNDNPLLMSK